LNLQIQAIHDLSRLRVQLEMDEECLRMFSDYEQPLRELKIAALMRDHKLAQFQNQEYRMKEEMDELKVRFMFPTTMYLRQSLEYFGFPGGEAALPREQQD